MTVPLMGTRIDNKVHNRQYKTIDGLPSICKIFGKYYLLKQSPQSMSVNHQHTLTFHYYHLILEEKFKTLHVIHISIFIKGNFKPSRYLQRKDTFITLNPFTRNPYKKNFSRTLSLISVKDVHILFVTIITSPFLVLYLNRKYNA